MSETMATITPQEQTAENIEPPAAKQKMSIILYSGTVDKLTAASILATGGAAMDGGGPGDLGVSGWSRALPEGGKTPWRTLSSWAAA